MSKPDQQSIEAMSAPKVGDHWKEWKDWNAYVTDVSGGKVTLAIYSDGHAPQRVTRSVEAFKAWLTFGGAVEHPWAVCYARGVDVSALQGAYLPPTFAPEPVKCQCRQCTRERKDAVYGIPPEFTRMILCDQCGNKRCPHANDHRHACTKSNELGQVGSAYA